MNSELLPKIIPTTHCIFILTNWLHRTIHSLVILTIQVLLFLSHSYDITWSILKITLEYCAKVAYLSTIYKYWRYLVIMKNTDASICSKSFWKHNRKNFSKVNLIILSPYHCKMPLQGRIFTCCPPHSCACW